MNLSLETLENELLAHLGLDASDFTNGLSDVDLLLNRSWWDISDKFKFREKEASTTFVTVAGTRQYICADIVSPSAFDSLRLLSIEDLVTFQHDPLLNMTLKVYEGLYINNTTEQAKPTNYIRDGGNIILYPTPDKVYTLTLYYRSTLSDLAVSGAPIPESWHEIILYGALWRGFARLGDYNRLNGAKKQWASLIESSSPIEAKEASNNPMAGLEVPGREY